MLAVLAILAISGLYVGVTNDAVNFLNAAIGSKVAKMRTILAVFSNAFSAKTAQAGMSLLAGKEGEKIAADIVNITDRKSNNV